MRPVALVASIALTISAVRAADEELPWAFANGSEEGYSLEPIAADPSPGTILCTGETRKFTITVGYVLAIREEGKIVLVIQDEMNNQISTHNSSKVGKSVRRGRGEVTLSDTLVVPATSRELRLFIPLVPAGFERTAGELVLRYPIRGCSETRGAMTG